jgi:hypothetical protein
MPSLGRFGFEMKAGLRYVMTHSLLLLSLISRWLLLPLVTFFWGEGGRDLEREIRLIIPLDGN